MLSINRFFVFSDQLKNLQTVFDAKADYLKRTQNGKMTKLRTFKYFHQQPGSEITITIFSCDHSVKKTRKTFIN